MYRKLVNFSDYIFAVYDRSKFRYDRTNTDLKKFDEDSKDAVASRRERLFDEILRKSGLKERFERIENLDGDKFEDAVEQFKKDKRIR